MKNKNLLRLLSITLLLLFLSACSSQEDQAQSRYVEALKIEAAGETPQAKILYQKIVSEFPETRAAASASGKLDVIEKRRLKALRQELFSILESLQNIIVGYQGMSGRFPQVMADFDDGIYFFDSDYMLQLLPEDVTAWIELQAETQKYRIWVMREGEATIYSLGQNSQGIDQLKSGQFIQQFQKNVTVVERKHNLLFVNTRTSSKIP